MIILNLHFFIKIYYKKENHGFTKNKFCYLVQSYSRKSKSHSFMDLPLVKNHGFCIKKVFKSYLGVQN